MARHKTVAVEGTDLYNRIFGHTDRTVQEVVGLDDVASDADESAVVEALRGTWWVVSWPEHVTTPRYNGDANYGRCRDEAEARELADCVYGE